MPRHECPHPDCDAQIATSLFSCRGHWFALPSTIRNRIHNAWSKVTKGDAAGLDEHDAARADALAHWAANS